MRVTRRLQKGVLTSAMALSLMTVPFTLAHGQQNKAFQGSGTSSTSAVSHSGQWLQRAQEAMSNGNLTLAEECIQRAEQGLVPGVILSYTPAMARAELARRRANVSTGTATRSAGQQYLLNARKALAIGDVDGATAAIAQARHSGESFHSGDSPAVLEGMVRTQNELVELYHQQAADSGYNQNAARFLMEQAQALTNYGEFETARVLVNQAKSFTDVNFAGFDISPDNLLVVINAKSQQGSVAPVAPAAVAAPAAAPAAVAEAPALTPKQQVSRLMAQAQFAIDTNETAKANELVQQALAFNLPEDQFAANEVRPWQLQLKLDNSLKLDAATSGIVKPAAWDGVQNGGVAQADYSPENDTTRNVQVAGVAGVADSASITLGDQTPVPTVPATRQAEVLEVQQDFNKVSRGSQLYSAGLKADAQGDASSAREYFRLAMQYPNDLDVNSKTDIQQRLGVLDAVPKTPESPVAQASADEKFGYEVSNQGEFSRLQSEVFREKQAAQRLMETNPREALQKMASLRTRVASSQLAAETSRPLLKIIDKDIDKMQRYIETNLAQIQNDEATEVVREQVKRDRQRRLDVDQQLAKLTDEYNELIDEGRFEEATLVVRQAEDLAPDNPVVVLLREKQKIAYSKNRWDDIRERKERGYQNELQNTLEKAVPFDDRTPLQFAANGDEYWEKVSRRRQRLLDSRYSSDSEREIWQKLKNTNVEGEYRGTLSEAMDQLARQAGLNIVFDAAALEVAEVSSDKIVNVPIHNPISLESALNVILSGVNLTFKVENEVINITSSEASEAKRSPVVHYIGDLLAPMKNYRNPNNLSFVQPGLTNGYNTGQGVLNVGNGSPVSIAASSNPNLRQQFGPGVGGSGVDAPQYGNPLFGTVGRQPQGGVSQQDFDVLISLIQDTVFPDSWADTGTGEGTIQAFPPNLSLIVTQSQKVQDEIRDLLKKLRELNDVQIVVEVRFVAIQDDFFEQIGVDFDFALNDNSGIVNPNADTQAQSSVIGISGQNSVDIGTILPTSNQDIQFSNNSFASSIPSFGGFDPTSVANFGFAILSDIEVFFLLNAGNGSTRATITEAPTVTLFNGQSGSVNDSSQQPFVTSVTPVVGDFAVAHQPIITILPDGSNLDVTATVSADRRSVTLSLVPFFSEITDVQTFTFAGSTVTQVSTNSLLDDILDTIDPTTADTSVDEIETVTEGVTIQLPVLATTSVNTVVSVPDGGTVLLGGIKRSAESRSEAGVPLLSSLPYINRLFTNVGLGRDTSNLMMMVTPRIIIQEEEEQKQVGVFGDEG